MPVNLNHLRRFAVARSLFAPTTLEGALEKLGFVQADPIRSPARAQDLILRHRVTGYRAGDLERRYSELDIEEDFFINYGFVSRTLHSLMHPRSGLAPWPPERTKQARAVLKFVREKQIVHPREVDEYFSHGTVRNYWGGKSNATTHLLDAMHYRGLLSVAGRVKGIRLYAARKPIAPRALEMNRDERIDAVVDVAVALYGPMPRASLVTAVGRLRYGVPQWSKHLRSALRRAQHRLSHADLDGIDWYWPAGEDPMTAETQNQVRFLAPFDPIVWDRRRFELFWGWPYRFEAYIPLRKRKLGYYALPLLWRDRVIGWGNFSAQNKELRVEVGYVEGQPPRDRVFKRSLEAELDSMRFFLGMAD